MKYCLDASSLLQAWVRAYPIDRFPTLWDEFSNRIKNGEIGFSSEVFREVARKDDGLAAWLGPQSKGVDPDEHIQAQVLVVLKAHPRLLNTKAGKSGADAFVIGTALHYGAKVVTEEGTSGVNNPKIPFVCQAMSLPHINVLSLIRELDLVF